VVRSAGAAYSIGAPSLALDKSGNIHVAQKVAWWIDKDEQPYYE